ncbi:HNH endonuclease family protein [Ulvibacter litoralis]|uniref:HNH nuclease domain-containing protein n=1 Tax=Ulvibacter litoralis TaxID=227084 RepID=A0A1G7HFF1_9FLAO|nr:DUF262 domain-containing protein [Ulvibacter litoralis]GHC57628.1 hypothetical protein GCM10008083_22760 [Ulvibacter litoralis]SDE99145.1 Protein of unknown function DUF262 [Ulvibacter litoralis]
MKIELKEITVRELTKGYQDNEEAGVVGYYGKLDIRPPYQREFIYKDKQRDAVIDTVTKGFPLNVMYWAVSDDGDYELIDGQQRTISLCQYVEGDFSVMVGDLPTKRAFHNLQDDEQEKILNYKLMIYICSGTDSQKLEWFKTINIAGEKLTEQELRNAVFTGSWVTDAKRYFSKNGCPAYTIGSDYLTGSPIRQDYLETAIKWISKGNIEVYMSNHQNDPNSLALWRYFQDVISWIEGTFPEKRIKFMRGIDWGELYEKFNDTVFDTAKLEKQIAELILDDSVKNKKGIYHYVLTGKQKYLNIRSFSDAEKQKAYERQKGICPICKEKFDISQMEGDHITPWIEGGKTNEENCQMLCREDNRRKSSK